VAIAMVGAASMLGPFAIAIVAVGAGGAIALVEPARNAVRRSCPRTSPGLALAIALVGAALMLLLINWPFGVVFVALGAMGVFSLLDPALNVCRRSWWLGAFLSAGTWLVLCPDGRRDGRCHARWARLEAGRSAG
jgi:hypothetical protein